MCSRMTIMYGERLSPSPGIDMPSGEIQNMTTEMPSTAVGNARGMSSSVSSHLLPWKFLRTMIHAIGSPTRMSMIVTMKAMLNELNTALRTVSLIPSLFRTRSTSSQSVNRLVTTKMDGTTITRINTRHAKTNQPLRTFLLSERSSILFRRDIWSTFSDECDAHDVVPAEDDLAETPSFLTVGRCLDRLVEDHVHVLVESRQLALQGPAVLKKQRDAFVHGILEQGCWHDHMNRPFDGGHVI